MKKLIVLCAAALYVTACARVDGERKNQARVPVAPQAVAPVSQQGPRQQPIPMNPGQAPAPTATTVTPIKTVCVPNVIREIRIVQVEKFERKSKSVVVVDSDDQVSSKMETIVKLKSGKVLSKVTEDGPDAGNDEKDVYDFKALTIKNAEGKLSFSRNKALSDKKKTDVYSVNEADLTATIFANIDNEIQRLSDEGHESICSYVASGHFSLSEKAKTVNSRILLVESYQLDRTALREVIRESRKK